VLSFLLWAAVGAFLGWLSTLILNGLGRRALVENMVAGTLGAALGGFFFQRSVSPNVVSVGSVVTALAGAVIVLALANLFMSERAR